MRGSRSDPRAEDTAEGVLWALTVDELRRLAKVFRQPPPNRKHDLVLAILSELGDGRLEVHYGRLGDLEKAAVAEAVHDPEGKHRADRFQAKYGGEPPGRSLPTYRNREEAGPLSLFFCGTDRIPADLKLRLLAFVPAPVEDRVKAEGEPPAVFDLEVSGWDRSTREYLRTTRGVPVVRRENERSALHDVVAVLRLVNAGKLTVGDTTRRPTAAAARAVASVLQGGDFYEENARGTEDRRIAGGKDPGRLEGVEAGRGSGAPATTEGGSESVAEGRNDTDSRSSLERRDRREPVGPIKAYAWPIIVQAGGLAKPLGTRLMLTKKGTELLGRPAVEAIRAAWDGWEVDSRFDEFLRIEAIKGQTGRGRRGMTAVDQRRTAVTSALAACPPGEWVSVDEFFRSIRASEDDFEVTRDESGLYIADPQYGSLGYRGYAEWSLLQGRYVLCVLFEYAATLGAIDVAYVPPAGVRRDYRGNWGTDDLEFLSRYDGLLSFRVTPLGAHLLDLTDEFTPAALPAAAVLRVLPNCGHRRLGGDAESGRPPHAGGPRPTRLGRRVAAGRGEAPRRRRGGPSRDRGAAVPGRPRRRLSPGKRLPALGRHRGAIRQDPGVRQGPSLRVRRPGARDVDRQRLPDATALPARRRAAPRSSRGFGPGLSSRPPGARIRDLAPVLRDQVRGLTTVLGTVGSGWATTSAIPTPSGKGGYTPTPLHHRTRPGDAKPGLISSPGSLARNRCTCQPGRRIGTGPPASRLRWPG